MTEKRADIIQPDIAPGQGEYADKPQWLKDRLEWFRDLRFGLMVHWGIYVQWGCIESWPLVSEDTWARPDDLQPWAERDKDLKRFQQDYWSLNQTFNPQKFDPDKWARLAKDAGMQYAAFTTKHHDGFCMFDTRLTDYRVTHPSCPFHKNPRADIAGEVFRAYRDAGLAVSCYFSKSDWHHPDYWNPDRPFIDRNPNYDTAAEPEKWERFARFVYGQIEELMSRYGAMDILWLDGGQVRPPGQDIHMDRIAAMARDHQPGLIIADRTVGGGFEDVLTPEQKVPEQPPEAPWETCMTMGSSWSYKPEDTCKSFLQILHTLIDVVAKNGNFLLNISPTPDGDIPVEQEERLQELAQWMQSNAEAVHGTRSVPAQQGQSSNVRYTGKDGFAYAIVLSDAQGQPPDCVSLAGVPPAEGEQVICLDTGESVSVDRTSADIKACLPTGQLRSRYAWVLRYRPQETP